MKTNIVAIGNSQGIRIPKILLEQSGLSGEVELEVRDEGILIKRSKQARQGWNEAFSQMAAHNDDELLIEGEASATTRENWRW